MKQFYYFFADAARIALQSINAQKLRAFLTLIGVIFGVASVVLVGASILPTPRHIRLDSISFPPTRIWRKTFSRLIWSRYFVVCLQAGATR